MEYAWYKFIKFENLFNRIFEDIRRFIRHSPTKINKKYWIRMEKVFDIL